MGLQFMPIKRVIAGDTGADMDPAAVPDDGFRSQGAAAKDWEESEEGDMEAMGGCCCCGDAPSVVVGGISILVSLRIAPGAIATAGAADLLVVVGISLFELKEKVLGMILRVRSKMLRRRDCGKKGP